jgi:tryptophan-rich sensory protein
VVTVLCVAIPVVLMYLAKTKFDLTESSPPPIVFSVAWSALYVLAGVALTLQGFGAGSSSSKIASLVLMVLVVAATWGWPFVYAVSRKGATWFIVGLLALTLCGMVAWGSPLAALWAPLAAWLVFALVLSTQPPLPSPTPEGPSDGPADGPY